MPFIDLSSPTNLSSNISNGNDMSALPQNTMPNNIVSAAQVDEPVVVQPAMQQVPIQQTAPTTPVMPTTPAVQVPVVAQVNDIKTTPNEEHLLLRNVPNDLEANPTSTNAGVKEFVGPSFNNVSVEKSASQSTNQSTNIIPNTPINLNVAPATVNLVQNSPIVPPKPQPSQPTQSPQAELPQKELVINTSAPVASIDQYLEFVVEKKASDLHIAVGFPPTVRLDGRLAGIGNHDLTADEIKNLLTPLLNKRLQDELLRNLDTDFSYTHKSGNRFRVNIFWSKGTMAAAFRAISSSIRTIAELKLPSICYDLIKLPHGLILFTGPTGSGKSTSIAAMIQEINLTESKHIVTIEDPVEYIFPRAKSIVNQREIGNDASNWKRSLRELLRQDPNIVVVGEMRDYETIAATVTVAETGHLVFATLHTNSASQTIDRIIDVFPDSQQPQIRTQLATVISAVISQRLVPLTNGGRKAVFEVMVATPAIKNAIREGKTYQIDNIIQTNLDQGMIPLEKSLVQLIRNGEITIEVAKEISPKPDELDSLLRGN